VPLPASLNLPRGRRRGKGGGGNGNGTKGKKSTKNIELGEVPVGWDVASFI